MIPQWAPSLVSCCSTSKSPCDPCHDRCLQWSHRCVPQLRFAAEQIVPVGQQQLGESWAPPWERGLLGRNLGSQVVEVFKHQPINHIVIVWYSCFMLFPEVRYLVLILFHVERTGWLVSSRRTAEIWSRAGIGWWLRQPGHKIGLSIDVQSCQVDPSRE